MTSLSGHFSSTATNLTQWAPRIRAAVLRQVDGGRLIRGTKASTSGRGGSADGRLLLRLRQRLSEDPAARVMLPLTTQVFLPLTLCFTAWAELAPVLPKFAESLGGGAGTVGLITASRSVSLCDCARSVPHCAQLMSSFVARIFTWSYLCVQIGAMLSTIPAGMLTSRYG